MVKGSGLRVWGLGLKIWGFGLITAVGVPCSKCSGVGGMLEEGVACLLAPLETRCTSRTDVGVWIPKRTEFG